MHVDDGERGQFHGLVIAVITNKGINVKIKVRLGGILLTSFNESLSKAVDLASPLL